MGKFIKSILCLLFAIAIFAVANEVSVARGAELTACGTFPMQNKAIQTTVTAAQSPFFTDAELAGSGMQVQQISMSRLQRINVVEYIFSLKSISQKMASHDAALSQHWCRLYATTTSYCCHPASEYYVFALRRIIV